MKASRDLTLNDRQAAAALLSRWMTSQITNWEFDDQWPWRSRDRAVVDIGREVWRYFSDLPEFRLGFSDLTAEQQGVLRRCDAFLRSGEEYEPVRYAEPRLGLLARLFRRRSSPELVDLIVDDERKRWWPFADEAQYRRLEDVPP